MILIKRIIQSIMINQVFFLIPKIVNIISIIYLKDDDFSMPISLNINFDNKKLQ